MKHLLVCSLYILLSCNQIASAQAELDKARELAKSALRLEQKEEYSEAIRLLEEAQKLDPTNDIYPYELAYVHYVLKDYKKAAGILEVVLERSSGMALLYQLLGNCYDLLKDPDRAIATYKKGLEYFPNSGPLFLELGTMELMSKNYDNALRYYEKGIELDPQFPSNYYRAAQIYCGSTERVWGLIYGELFMNIERNSERTVFVSKMLYETYKSAIVFNSDPKSLTNLHVAFCKNSEIKIDDRGQAVTNILPFGIGVYEPTFALSMIPIIMAGKVDSTIYVRPGLHLFRVTLSVVLVTSYPNLLFSYQKRVLDAGHIDAYNHWVLSRGDDSALKEWIDKNKDKWTKFLDWYAENQMVVDDKHKFYRRQY